MSRRSKHTNIKPFLDRIPVLRTHSNSADPVQTSQHVASDMLQGLIRSTLFANKDFYAKMKNSPETPKLERESYRLCGMNFIIL